MMAITSDTRNKRFFDQLIDGKHMVVCEGVDDEMETDCQNGSVSQRIVVKLFDRADLNAALGEKEFLWPETDLPKISVEFAPKLILLIKGKKNVAQLPIQVPRRGLPKLPSGSAFSGPAIVHESFGSKSEQVNLAESFVTLAQAVIQKPQQDAHWKALLEMCANKSALSVHSLSSSEQLQLIFLLHDRHKKDEAGVLTIFTELLRRRVLTTSLYPQLVQRLMELDSSKLILVFIKLNNTVIVDDLFVDILKYAIEMKGSQMEEVFTALLRKGFSPVFLQQYFATKLTVQEAIEVLNLGVDTLDQKATDGILCERAIDLLLALIDSHCEKLIWEDSCYATLKRAKDYIQSMAEMTTAFTRLLSKNKARSELPDIEATAETDFIVEKVKFRKLGTFNLE